MHSFSCRNDVLYGIYGDRGALRIADHKVVVNEETTSFLFRPKVARGPNSPSTIWDAELDCRVTNESIGCWPEQAPCLFNVRQDPCEMNNLAYYYPDLLQTMIYNLNKYNESAKYRIRKRRDIEETILYKDTVKKLEKSSRQLERISKSK